MSESREIPEVQVSTIIMVAGAIIGFLIAFLAILYLVFPNLVHRPAAPIAQFPTPSVTTDERTQRVLLERAANERLSGKNGTMPIDRAMAVIAAKGAAAYQPVQSTP
jgi:hypothetical protein